MSIFLQPTQRSATITFEGVADEELQVWMEDVSTCVNDLVAGTVPSSLIVNGGLVSDLTLEGRSTTYSASDGAGTFTHFENFSYNTIPFDETITIRANQQMIVDGTLDILGTVDSVGELVVI